MLFGGTVTLVYLSCSCTCILRDLEQPAKARGTKVTVEGVIQMVVLPSQWINTVFSADAVKWINLRLLLCTLLSKYPSEIFAELVI